jgi:LytS/YehU family sensor histidine kinase
VTTAPAVLAYAVLDRWPRRLPSWAPRWVLQLLAIVAVMPPGVYLSYVLTEGTWDVVALGDRYRAGLAINIFIGAFLGPWIALGALLRRSEAFAREQALAFQLKSSELERKALDSRLKLLQAQVEPHFLFNTLANIRSLVRKSGSAEAATLLDSLIVYLRAAVPKLDAEHCTIGQEQQTVRAYLELMQMRMPDRLSYAVDIESDALAVQCPPMVLLTLVENAIKHGIDPGESGGSVDVRVILRDGRVQVRVADTGVGLQSRRGEGAGTGLTNLRERLALAYGGDARVTLTDGEPRGTVAEVEFPARSGASS